MKKTQEKLALVIGGSMAGLLATRVLIKHFDQVILVEKDPMHDWPESRKGQPQTRHLHGLLIQGMETLKQYFPDLLEDLKTSGNPVVDVGKNMRWFCHGNYRTRFLLGVESISVSRPFLEWKIRQRVAALPKVKIQDGYRVEKILFSDDNQRVIGVKVSNTNVSGQEEVLLADLVVDASGRGSQAPRWLTEAGYSSPEEREVTCGTGYATRIFKRNPQEPSSLDWIFITPDAPKERRLGAAFPIEHNQWIVSLGGWHGDHAPNDEAGFKAFARSLPAPDVYNIVSQCEPVSPIIVHKFPASVRRHYEKLNRFPDGYLVLGDAVCSFNPLYGQGMTSAILQAAQLDRTLSEQPKALYGIAKAYFRRIAKIIDIPWQTAVSEDFRFPETKGKKAPGTDWINAYVARINRATHYDPVVGATLLKTMNMTAPPTSLFRPGIIWRVLRSG
jgi:2-polyprenyl-6-methoxyphenol hydroxylase-like FAD-dependent oxidoreductase